MNQQFRLNLQFTHYLKILLDFRSCWLVIFQSKEFFVRIYMLLLILIIHLKEVYEVGYGLIFERGSYHDLRCAVVFCLFRNVLLWRIFVLKIFNFCIGNTYFAFLIFRFIIIVFIVNCLIFVLLILLLIFVFAILFKLGRIFR